jgi:creatinine amidohydrolase/Fe(II)-dependent formamide hydrolase-like protein
MKLHLMTGHDFTHAIQKRWPLFIPAGTIEYHGEHLPLGVDTLAAIKALDEVEKKINCVVAPPVWFGPSSFAVAGPEMGTINVDTNQFEKQANDILHGFLENGFRQIFVVIHHQYEMGQMMPEALAFKKASVSLIFRLLEKEHGKGWWGSEKMSNYYNNLQTNENPFNWIQVIPLMSPEIQKKMGYDHAGKLETSLMMASYPETVKMQYYNPDFPWYTKDAINATKEWGEETFRLIVEYLIRLVS